MNRQRINDHVAMPIIISLLYTVYFYLVTKLIIECNMLISINNIGTKFIDDFFVMILVPLILIISCWRLL